MKKIFYFLLLLFLCIVLVGCAEKKLLERVGLVTLIGYDLGKEKSLETTAVVRQVSTELVSKVAIITAENDTSQGTRAKINRRAAEKVMNGQLRGILYGEEVAKDGIGNYIVNFLNDPALSGNIIMAVVEGQTKPLLEYQYPDIEDIGEHIYKLLEQNVKSEQVVLSTLHEISKDYYFTGKDIAMPILRRDDELIEMSGIALFKKDKMVGELSLDDSFYLKLSRDDYQAGIFELKINGDDLPSSEMENPPDKTTLVFDPIKSHKEVKLVNPTTPEFALHFKVQGELLEIKPYVDTVKVENRKALEKAISKSMSSEISRIIAYTQEVDSDVFGYGEIYRSSVRHSELTEEKWHELYKDMKVNVDVDFTLLRGGVFE